MRFVKNIICLIAVLAFVGTSLPAMAMMICDDMASSAQVEMLDGQMKNCHGMDMSDMQTSSDKTDENKSCCDQNCSSAFCVKSVTLPTNISSIKIDVSAVMPMAEHVLHASYAPRLMRPPIV